jgi:hypothetical protein
LSGRGRCRERNTNSLKKKRWGEEESKRERMGWRNCNSKMWNNGEEEKPKREGKS